MGRELLGDLIRKRGIEAALDVDRRELCKLGGWIGREFLAFAGKGSACSVSAWELTETYSPAAIDIAPATNPATPATKMSWLVARAAATPKMRLAVDTMPSFAPMTAARSQPMRSVRCRSL